jgi:replicative DNA helicase
MKNAVASYDLLARKGLPASTEAERFVLGSILLDDQVFEDVHALLETDDFSLEKHKRIYLRMVDLHARGERIDRITLANELTRHDQLDSAGGLDYLASIDDGIPQLSNVESYIQILKGKTLARRQIAMLDLAMTELIAGTGSDESVNELLDRTMRLRSEQGKTILRPAAQVIEERGIQNFINPAGAQGVAKVRLPWVALAQVIPFLRAGQFIVVAARRGIGKSSALAQICEAAGQQGGVAALFTLEMEEEEVFLRIVCGHAGISSHSLECGYRPTKEERAKLNAEVNALCGLPFHIDGGKANTVPLIVAACRKLKSQFGLGIVGVDYLQLVSGSSRRNYSNRQEEVSEVSRGLKLAAGQLGVPVVAAAHLKRPEGGAKEKEPRPGLSDLKESGAIENDADKVIFLHPVGGAPFYTQAETPVEFIVAKQRGGPTRLVELTFLRELTKFV